MVEWAVERPECAYAGATTASRTASATSRLSVRAMLAATPCGAEDGHRVGVVLEADAGGRRRRWRRSGRGAWRSACLPALASRSSVSAAKPTSIWPGRLRRAEPGEDVGRRLEHDLGGGPSSFLSLLSAATTGPEVGHGGGHDDDVGCSAASARSRPASGRGLHRDQLDAGRRRSVDRGHQRHLGAPADGRGGDGVALLARRAVGDDPHRVDRLAGAARR